MLCNVNMLLIFEDGNGTLVQYSRDKIKSIASFFKECKYNNVLELSSKDVSFSKKYFPDVYSILTSSK